MKMKKIDFNYSTLTADIPLKKPFMSYILILDILIQNVNKNERIFTKL